MMDLEKLYFQKIEEEINALDFDKDPANLYGPIRYFLNIGGKRIRPILTLLTAEAYGTEAKDALNAAKAIELFHNFTLVHDDIMDEAPTRRGKQTVHLTWDANIAILSGDLILIKAYQQLESYEPPVLSRLFSLLNKTAIEVCEGQQMDMDFEKIDHVAVQEYIEMIRLKTSVLIGCALSFGSIISNCKAEESEAIYNFGVSLGIAFQIQDDILDLFGDAEKVGKLKGGDVLKKKKSILTILALENGFKWEELSKFSHDVEKIEYVVKRFYDLKINSKALQLMNSYSQEALSSLNTLENHKAKALLKLFAKSLLEREK